jgi:PAS domain-containing protein
MLISGDLSRSYVNNVARELLQGLSLSTVDEKGREEEALGGWWDNGIWVIDEMGDAAWDSLDGNPVVPGDQASAEVLDRKGTDYSIGGRAVPDTSTHVSGAGTSRSVATILAKSLTTSRNRRRRRPTTLKGSLMDGVPPDLNHISPQAATTSGVHDVLSNLPLTHEPDTCESTEMPTSLKKPYRIFDATFSERIYDPLEHLFETCGRRGLEARVTVGGSASAVVGIEVDIVPSSDMLSDTFVTVIDDGATSETSGARGQRKVMRRRVVEVGGAPIKKASGEHMGGLLMLRDITDEWSSSQVDEETRLNAGCEVGNAYYYKRILDHMPQMVWTTSPSGSWTYCNLRWFDFT